MDKKKKVQYAGRLRSYLQWPIVIALMVIVMNILVYILDVRAGFLVSAFGLCILIVLGILHFSYRPKIMNEMIYFATQYGQIQKTLLKELDIPYALLDYDGRIIWMNLEFSHAVGKDEGYKKNIINLFPEIDSHVLPAKKERAELHLTFGERDYRVELKKVSVKELMDSVNIVDGEAGGTYMIAMYLFDETELRHYILENQNQKLVAGMIYLDNYDEALESLEEVRRSLLVALVDRKISKYISGLDGIVRKTETDKYFIVLNNKSLKELESNRFSLLEEVKAVNIGNEMKVTLSIGIGVNGSTYNQNCEFARVAIELALGRGGDQAVVKDSEKISYYGGKSQQMEKSTRVKARVKAHALREFIGSKDRVVVMGHKNTDIDSFGAAIGVYCAGKMMGKKVHIVLSEISASIRSWVALYQDNSDYPEDMFVNHQQAINLVDDNTVVIVVDTNRPSMTECPELLEQTKTIVVLDHHRQSSEVIQNAVLSYIEPYASSACEMIAEVLQYFTDGAVKLKSQEADCIYAGIIIDTNNYVAKTGVRTFEAAAFLRRCGADVTRVRKMFRNDMDSYKARAEAVRHAEVFAECYAISSCPSDGLESPTVVGAQAANELLNIIGIKASFVITDYRNTIYISARAIDEVNVQLIMERLGGGGHLNIAGAQLKDTTVEATKNLIKATIQKMTEEGAI